MTSAVSPGDLSPRDVRILEGLARNYSYARIAAWAGVTVPELYPAMRALRERFHAPNNRDLIHIAVRAGLLDPRVAP